MFFITWNVSFILMSVKHINSITFSYNWLHTCIEPFSIDTCICLHTFDQLSKRNLFQNLSFSQNYLFQMASYGAIDVQFESEGDLPIARRFVTNNHSTILYSIQIFISAWTILWYIHEYGDLRWVELTLDLVSHCTFIESL